MYANGFLHSKCYVNNSEAFRSAGCIALTYNEIVRKEKRFNFGNDSDELENWLSIIETLTTQFQKHFRYNL